MKISEFSQNRLNDYVMEKLKECEKDPFLSSPFGSSEEGNFVSVWKMSLQRAGFFSYLGGRNIFGTSDLIMIHVPSTETGISPLTDEDSYGWDGKINEFAAELAVSYAFELYSDIEMVEFLRTHKPEVIFSYFDSNGPGSITVKYNGRYWAITG